MTTATAIVAGHGIAFRRSLHMPNPPGKPSFSVARPHAHYRLLVPATPSPRPCRSISSESPTAAAADTAEDEEEEPAATSVESEEDVDPLAEVCYLDPDADAEGIREWEVDFCSRPILDARGKKVWELVVCDATLSLQFTRFFPNTSINSVTLRDALASVASSLGVPLPDRARFFRSQMQTIISRACNDLGVKAVPSRRCVSLLLWLEERYETVYSRHPGFQKGTKPLLTLDNPFATNLPDNLFGDKWAFVQLPFDGQCRIHTNIVQSVPLYYHIWTSLRNCCLLIVVKTDVGLLLRCEGGGGVAGEEVRIRGGARFGPLGVRAR